MMYVNPKLWRAVFSVGPLSDINMSEIKCDLGCYDTVLRTSGLNQRTEKECRLNAAIVTFGSRPVLFGGIRTWWEQPEIWHPAWVAVSLLMRFLIPLSLSFFFGKGILQVTLEGYSDF